ncbi:hypothetical protein J6590_097873 [Homalodisca vitripennis]|nr:hypothetical protein J6590_097873 [Homalodisca vitripennis]
MIDSPLTLAEILEALEDTASEYTAADIYVNEESGEEDSNDPDRVCRRQLQAEAKIRFEGIENDEDTPGDLGDQRGDLSDVGVEDRGNNLQIATHSKATGKRKLFRREIPLQCEIFRYSVTERKKVSIPQPYLIAQYNSNMGGVNLMDNNISNYRIGVR